MGGPNEILGRSWALPVAHNRNITTCKGVQNNWLWIRGDQTTSNHILGAVFNLMSYTYTGCLSKRMCTRANINFIQFMINFLLALVYILFGVNSAVRCAYRMYFF